MFVSSYSTFIQTNDSQKTAKNRVEKPSSDAKDFSVKLKENIGHVAYKTSNIPINHISQSQVFNNKQELDSQTKKLQDKNNKTTNTTKEMISKFNGKSSLMNLSSTYTSNTTMFSLMRKPHTAFDQTPHIEKTLPEEPKDIKELNMRHKMVNAYIANENYYRVTA